MHAHWVVRGAPRNEIGRQRGKHDALAVDDLLPLGKFRARQLGQRRELRPALQEASEDEQEATKRELLQNSCWRGMLGSSIAEGRRE